MDKYIDFSCSFLVKTTLHYNTLCVLLLFDAFNLTWIVIHSPVHKAAQKGQF